MSRLFQRVNWALDPGTCFWWALLVLCLPVQWLLAALAAACIHEAGHTMAVCLCRGKVISLRIGISGAALRTACISPGKEILCSLAGPFASILCLLLIPVCPMVALCGFFQGIYNLLPVYPLDGGRVLLGILRILCRKDPDGVFLKVQTAFSLLLFLVAVYVGIRFEIGLLSIFPALVLLFRKIPCKDGKHRLQ